MGEVSELEEIPRRTRINLWVTPSTYKFLEYASNRDGRSMSDIIREALRDFVLKDAQFVSVVDKIDAKLTRGNNDG